MSIPTSLPGRSDKRITINGNNFPEPLREVARKAPQYAPIFMKLANLRKPLPGYKNRASSGQHSFYVEAPEYLEWPAVGRPSELRVEWVEIGEARYTISDLS